MLVFGDGHHLLLPFGLCPGRSQQRLGGRRKGPPCQAADRRLVVCGDQGSDRGGVAAVVGDGTSGTMGTVRRSARASASIGAMGAGDSDSTPEITTRCGSIIAVNRARGRAMSPR